MSTPSNTFVNWPYVVGFIAIGILTVLPLIVAETAQLIGQSQGCQIDESGIFGCRLPPGVSAQLGGAYITGWLILFTIPLGIVLALILGIARSIHYGFWKRRQQDRLL